MHASTFTSYLAREEGLAQRDEQHLARLADGVHARADEHLLAGQLRGEVVDAAGHKEEEEGGGNGRVGQRQSVRGLGA